MNRTPKRQGGCQCRSTAEPLRQLRGHAQSPTLPRDWRARLPAPGDYYPQRVAKLSKPNATGWAQGTCPFHEDRNASLSVHVSDTRGAWRCFAQCGGGDLVAFHMRFAGKPFKEAVADLVRCRA